MKNHHFFHKIISLLILFLGVKGIAQEIPQPQTYVAHKIEEPIIIDGKADEDVWKKAEWTADFIDIEGVKTPKYRTRVKMLWDETYIYYYAEMEEPHVWATLKQRDTIIFHNNDFEIFWDTDGDTHNYYEFEVNAFNTIWDLFLTKPYRETNAVIDGWDISGVKSAVHINGTLNDFSDTDKGWSVEIAVPWSAFRTSFGQDNVPRNNFWRINFSRVNWDYEIVNGKYQRKKDGQEKYLPEYNWVWSPQNVINMHEPEKWGYVFFSETSLGSKVRFEIPKDEKIKWEMYAIYRQYKQGKEITSKTINIDNQKIKINLEKHSFGWNLSTESPFSGKKLQLKEDGKWIENP